MEKIRILIAEDHKLIRETWVFLMDSDSRFEVVAACSDSAEAISNAQKHLPDIILMDVNILPYNGFQATSRILKVSPKSKVIGLSFHSELIVVQKMFAAGAKGYLTKNSGREEMYEAIVRVHSGSTFVCAEIREKGFQICSTSRIKEPDVELLTNKEIQISQCIKEGLRSKEIADKLKMSIRTVDTHRYNILRKLNVKSSISLVNLLHSRNANMHYST